MPSGLRLFMSIRGRMAEVHWRLRLCCCSTLEIANGPLPYEERRDPISSAILASDLKCSSQVAVEVHDIDGRLASTVDLLTSKPAAFDEVCWELQRTSEVDGYVMVVPSALKMYLVFAKRRRKPGVAGSLTAPTTAQGSLCESTSRGTGVDVSAGDTAWRRGRDRQQKGGDMPMPSEYCSCSLLDGKV